jgi:integrase/recombinase XerD
MTNCDFSSDELFAQFLKEKRYLNNVSNKTIDTYEGAWRAFKRFNGVISMQGLKDFVVSMVEAKLTPGTINTRLRSINSYLTWLKENDYTDQRHKIQLLPEKRKVLSTYKETDLAKVLNSKPKKLSHKRLVLILSVLAGTGMRVNECLELRREDIDFDNFLITVKQGKGGKQRKCPMSLETKAESIATPLSYSPYLIPLHLTTMSSRLNVLQVLSKCPIT